MRHLHFFLIIVVSLLSYQTLWAQTRTNWEKEEWLQYEQDSLRAYSDSLYGIGMSLYKKGDELKAIDYFMSADSIDSYNKLYYEDDLRNMMSGKAWSAYILFKNGNKDVAEQLMASLSDLVLSLNTSDLYNAKPTDRRIKPRLLDSLRKQLGADSTITAYDRNYAEAELMRKSFGANHYLYAESLWGLGSECFNPLTALYYLRKAKKIFDQYGSMKFFSNKIQEKINEKEKIISSDSLLDEGIKLYKSAIVS